MSSDGPSPVAHGRSPGSAWPLLAAGATVLASLGAVFVLLQPRDVGDAARAGQDEPATVTVDRIDLRREPSPQGDPVAALPEGMKLRVKADQGRWVEVETGAGEHGFLPADTLERDADRGARQKRAKTLLSLAPVFGVVGENADVVLAPYPLAARGGRLAKGSVIAIHSVDHSYFAFADKKWGVAFVASAQVDLVPPDPRQPAVAAEKVKPLKDLTVIDLEGEPPPEEEGEDEAMAQGDAPPGSPTPPSGPIVPPEPAPGLVEPPAVLARVDPVYPELARRAGIEGTVEMEVSIDASGKVTDVEVVRGLPLGLSQAAADAVRQWTYRPARTAGGSVASRKTVRVNFVLRAEDAR